MLPHENQPLIAPLSQILKEILRGQLRLPRFQRSAACGGFRPEQRGDLLDSLYRGFPVGTILVWETDAPLATQDVVGGIAVAPRAPFGPVRLLLDGQRRLSALVGILGPGLKADLAADEPPETARGGIFHDYSSAFDEDAAEHAERWVYDLGNTDKNADKALSSRERFVLIKRDHEATATQLPLSIVYDAVALRLWIDEHEGLSEAQRAEALGLRDRFQAAVVPAASLVAGSLEDATESIKRINASSAPIGEFEMVAARVLDGTIDMVESFAEARAEYLAPIGWDAVSDAEMLSVCAGLAGMNPVRYDIESLSTSFRSDSELVSRAFQAVVSAAELLAGCGVLGLDALPYGWQLLTLAVVLGRNGGVSPLDASFVSAGQKWFWITTYGEAFAGGNVAALERSLSALEEMLAGRSWTKMERDITRQVRPVDVFDKTTARSKACALSMARYQDRGRLDGPAHQALAASPRSMQLLLPGSRRAKWWHWVIVTPGHGLSLLRSALRRRESDASLPQDDDVLEMLGVSASSRGTMEALLETRRAPLLAEERAFVDSLGLVWAAG